jgi:hypothetical protein
MQWLEIKWSYFEFPFLGSSAMTLGETVHFNKFLHISESKHVLDLTENSKNACFPTAQ